MAWCARRAAPRVTHAVHEHNHVLPHSAFRGQTLDDMYVGTGGAASAESWTCGAFSHSHGDRASELREWKPYRRRTSPRMRPRSNWCGRLERTNGRRESRSKCQSRGFRTSPSTSTAGRWASFWRTRERSMWSSVQLQSTNAQTPPKTLEQGQRVFSSSDLCARRPHASIACDSSGKSARSSPPSGAGCR